MAIILAYIFKFLETGIERGWSSDFWFIFVPGSLWILDLKFWIWFIIWLAIIIVIFIFFIYFVECTVNSVKYVGYNICLCGYCRKCYNKKKNSNNNNDVYIIVDKEEEI